MNTLKWIIYDDWLELVFNFDRPTEYLIIGFDEKSIKYMIHNSVDSASSCRTWKAVAEWESKQLPPISDLFEDSSFPPYGFYPIVEEQDPDHLKEDPDLDMYDFFEYSLSTGQNFKKINFEDFTVPILSILNSLDDYQNKIDSRLSGILARYYST